ncbi:SCO6880 family protein [Vallicoccus soli]|uniref:Uncharacterized protein n=1 Tax=Vallicoccus soli TaxID=2339232 RepID=A0A3A3YYL5_9ACTN|nr:SCO6880 family protein [Vallicoccus soli]RJK95922.1 hypothetical protein D5H78_09990 [Vallicoccus soli]
MSASSLQSSIPVRTYGGWRRTRGIGLFGLGAGTSVVVMGCVVVPLIAVGFSLSAGLATAAPALVVAGLTLARWDGVPLAHVVQRRLHWWWASARGWTTLRASTVVDHSGAWTLPGPLAATRLLEVEDGRGGTFGVVHDQRAGHLTATLRCAATSTWLVDGSDADGWVSNWHAWLASRGFDPLVAWVGVTVETAPEPGSTLVGNVHRRLEPSAPPDVRRLMDELVSRSPAAAADVDTRVSVTFDPARAAERLPDLADQAAEVSRALNGMESALGECGVSVLGRARAHELAGVLRTAYDPRSRGEVNRIVEDTADPQTLLQWTEAGPVAADEGWDTYRHDSGLSVSWAWHEAPRQQVTSDVMTRLLAPGRHPKRVTMLYRPLPAGQAARLLEDQVNAAAFREAYRRTQGRDATARDQADRDQAVAAAREEAMGAGVVLMSLYVTVTVTDPDELPAAVADVEARADQSKIRLRRLYGSQAAGFAATLPAGVHPQHLADRGLR